MPAGAAAAVVRLRVQQEPVAPELDALYRHLGVTGPGRGGVRTTTGTAFATADPPVLVTNHHVIAGARSIIVEGPDGTPLATLDDPRAVRVDHRADIAVLTLPGLPLGGLRLGRAGPDEAITLIGFPNDGALGARSGRLTGEEVRGIVGRPPRRLLLTDVPVDRGLSGGPALDGAGAVVALVVAGSRPDSSLRGQGLLVPGEAVADAVARLAGPCPDPWLGVRVDPEGRIRAVTPDGPADRAGVEVGDTLVGDAWDALGPCAAAWTVARGDAHRTVPAGVRPEGGALRIAADGRVLGVDDAAFRLGLDAGDAIVGTGSGADIADAVVARTGPRIVRVADKGWVVLPPR